MAPDQHWYYHSLGPLLVHSGDLENYRRHCAAVLARFGQTDDPVVAARMAKDCLIIPAVEINANAVAKLADTAVTKGKYLPWQWFAFFEFVKGLSDYRQGRFADAVERMQHILAHTVSDSRDAEASMVLAMAQRGLGKLPESRAAFDKGIKIIDTKLPKLDSNNIGADWRECIIVNALLNEAKELVENQPPEAKR
jgi:Flp pilus assembly protein TadD